MNPLVVLDKARKAVPILNYALGVVGVAAAGAIIIAFLGPTRTTFVVMGSVLLAMILLIVSSTLVTKGDEATKWAGIVLVWSVALSFCSLLALSVSAFAFGAPSNVAVFLGLNPSSPSESQGVLPSPDRLVRTWSPQFEPSSGPTKDSPVGSVELDSGIDGHAYSFHEPLSYIQIDASFLPVGDSDRSFEIWFMLSAGSKEYRDQMPLFCYGDIGTNNEAYYVYYSQEFGLAFSNWGQSVHGSDSIRPGDWHQVVVTNSGSNVRFYLDGRPVATGNVQLDTPKSMLGYLGGLPENTAADVKKRTGYDLRLAQFRGRIAIARMYNSALTDDNIVALYRKTASAHSSLFPK